MALTRVKNKFIDSLEGSKLFGTFPDSPSQVDGAALTGIAGVDYNTRNNLALNYFGDSVRNNMDRIALDQGWVDTFEDTSDVVGEGFSLQSTIFGGELYKKTAALTGATNGKKGIISFWMDFNGDGISAAKYIFTSGGADNFVGMNGGHKLAFGFKNADGGGDISFFSTKVFTNADGWYHVLASYDLGGSGTVLSNVDMWITPLGGTEVSDHDKGTGTYVNANIAYTDPTFALGGVAGTPSSMFRGSLAQCYWNYSEYLDISVEANRRKFTTADGYPINFGSTGSVPTDSQPIAYFDGDLSINKGTGGNLDVTEAIYTNGSPTLSGYLDLSDTNALYSSESFSNSYELLDSHGKENLSGGGFTVGDHKKAGQCITLSSSSTITKLGFWVRKVGTISGNITAEIHGVTGTPGSSATSNNIILNTSNGIESSTVSTSHNLLIFTFPTPSTLSAGNYWVGINAFSMSGGGSNYLETFQGSNSDADGNASKQGSDGVWTGYASNDIGYYLYGQKNLTLITKGSDDIGNSPATAPEKGHMEVLMTERPASATSVWSETGTNSSGTGWANYSVRQILSAANISSSGNKIRVTLYGPFSGATESMQLANVSIVERNGSTANGTTTPTEILFGGVSGINIPKESTTISDWLDYEIDSTKDYLLIADFGSQTANDNIGRSVVPSSATNGSYDAITSSYNTAVMTNASARIPTINVIFSKLETAVEQVINTDFIGQMSRDGGTTYSPVVLSRTKTQVANTNYNMLVGEADFAGDPSGTNIVGKVYTANKDKITVKGISVNWK